MNYKELSLKELNILHAQNCTLRFATIKHGDKSGTMQIEDRLDQISAEIEKRKEKNMQRVETDDYKDSGIPMNKWIAAKYMHKFIPHGGTRLLCHYKKIETFIVGNPPITHIGYAIFEIIKNQDGYSFIFKNNYDSSVLEDVTILNFMRFEYFDKLNVPTETPLFTEETDLLSISSSLRFPLGMHVPDKKEMVAVPIQKEGANSPLTVCICGSTKFKHEFEQANKDFTLKGYIVLTVGFFGHCDEDVMTDETKSALDKLHLKKIGQSDLIYIVNKDGYVGESTRKEIEYAQRLGRNIGYMEEVKKCSEASTKNT